MTVRLIAITPEAGKHIEYCARLSHDSGDRITEDSFGKFIVSKMKIGHFSILEHASATFYIEGISRACSHQLVRHRLASFTQKSQRYVREGDFSYTVPPAIADNPEAVKIFKENIENTRAAYNALIGLGIRKEDARFILPNAAHTLLSMTANFREWLHIIDMRVEAGAQWEIREMTEIIWKELYSAVPHVFGLDYFSYESHDFDYKKKIFNEKIV